jgi:hypothetical protein
LACVTVAVRTDAVVFWTLPSFDPEPIEVAPRSA